MSTTALHHHRALCDAYRQDEEIGSGGVGWPSTSSVCGVGISEEYDYKLPTKGRKEAIPYSIGACVSPTQSLMIIVSLCCGASDLRGTKEYNTQNPRAVNQECVLLMTSIVSCVLNETGMLGHLVVLQGE
jgi:hypothetical protein